MLLTNKIMKEIVWGTFETYKGNIAKQHAFTFEEDEQGVKRNKRICGGYVTSEDGGLPDRFEEIKEQSEQQKDDCCKRCLSKLKKPSE